MRILRLSTLAIILFTNASFSADDFVITINGAIKVNNKKTCIFNAPEGASEVVFMYKKDKVPNYYYIWNNVTDFESTKKGIASQYFKFIDYRVTCSFKPPTDSSIQLSYLLNGDAKISASGSRTLWTYLESSQNDNAGFIIRRKNDDDWLNFKSISNQSQSYSVNASEFVKDSDGSYSAIMSYAVAFTGVDLKNQNFSDELVDSNLINAGAYSRNVTLNVNYN
ncbi:hypothetical protein EYY87_07795 [Hafnia paralvei]|uniref:hypothetical protein n=1 Tax=Hafnia paralvei TaxID=546367 RepID=UPI0010EE872F|nr:hypothetical protein [Hafnia paralvei]TBM05986.1 hypothetical protein EYY87_07795 [Hafnia paralvei]